VDSKIILSEKEIPTEWYNIIPDLPLSLLPATSYRTGYAVGLHDL
jgi:predicted alternative tryptophan synthase beta-subunit